MNKEPLLDEDSLGRLIVIAYDRLPEPEPSRLKAVEERLARALPRRAAKQRNVGWYWWLIIGLVATGAAAWSVLEYFSEGQVVPAVEPLSKAPPAISSERAPPRQPENSAPQGVREPTDKRRPFIFERER